MILTRILICCDADLSYDCHRAIKAFLHPDGKISSNKDEIWQWQIPELDEREEGKEAEAEDKRHLCPACLLKEAKERGEVW